MSVKRPLLSLLLLTSACGPRLAEDWMIGTFSSRSALGNAEPASVSRYEFTDDHTVIWTLVQACGAVEREFEAQWESQDDETIRVIPTEPDEAEDEYFPPFGGESTVRYVQKCAEVDAEVVEVRSTDPASLARTALTRGAMCLQPPTPESQGLNECSVEWCNDVQPSPCPHGERYRYGNTD